MSKTRVHELAAEFGVESEQVITLAADMDIHVRSHMSAFDADQVALVRARWERDKRRKPEAATKKRRRKRATAAAPTEPEAAAEPKRPVRRRRKASDVAAANAATAEEEAKEAELVAAHEAQMAEEAQRAEEERLAAEAAQVEAARKADELEQAAEVETEEPVTEAVVDESEPAEADQAVPATPPAEAPAGFVPHRVPRPVKKVVRPVASSAPRPVASSNAGGPADSKAAGKAGARGKRGKRGGVDKAAVKANINKTLASLKTPKGKKGRSRRDEEPTFRALEEQRREDEKEREKTLVKVTEFITVSELSEILKVTPTDIVTFCFKQMGMMVTVNQRLDFDQIELVAGEFGYVAEKEEAYEAEETVEEEIKEEELEPRPPVVTVMGHVDHGKTSVLDYTRKENVIAGEAGGITQHIGAYHVELHGRVVTFLDTPGHEAFTAMRARGAQSTDMVVLVIAADDQVMPQTVEAISHARTAGVPIIVAINKIDLPAANIEKVKQDLLQHEVVLEEFGGEVLCSQVSAKTGDGMEDLYEKILLQADLLDLKAPVERAAKGVVIESTLDPGKGPLATILVQSGTLRSGDHFLAGNLYGRARAMLDERGKKVEKAGPSVPVQILGLEGVPQAGDSFTVMANAPEARELAQKRQRLDREASHRRASRGVSLEDFSRQVEAGEVQSLKVVIKADEGGPAEALADAFAKLSTSEVRIEVVHRAVGAVKESDVILAKAGGAVIIAFHVRPDANARAAAEREKVEIKTYKVIYEAVDDIRAALEGMLRPEEREVVLGEAEVLQIFKISGTGTIAGCKVTQGIIERVSKVRVVREGVEIYEGELASLKRFQDDAKEVREGLECGMSVENFNDLKVGDVLESFTVEQIARTLESVGAQGDS